MRGSKSMSVSALSKRRKNATVIDRRYRRQLTFFARARSFSAAVALGEFFNATGRIHEFLFTGKKRMTSGADTDSNVTARRTRFVDRTACADDICLVILWVNACFHRQK